MIITRTPMRITLGGGGTDVTWYSRLRGGAWISAAIDKYIYVILKKNASEKYIINNKIIAECLRLVKVSKDISITILSDAQPGSGLGGSGTLEVGLLNALYSFKKIKTSKTYLAKKASEIEIKHLERPVGPQDQYIAALGGINFFEINKNGKVTVQPLKLSAKSISMLENNLLYFKTGLVRNAATILAGEKKQLTKKSDPTNKIINKLDAIKLLGLKIKKYLLAGDIDNFGYALHEHWLIKKELTDKISNKIIDGWYNEAQKAGALGGKIMGAGGGGWLVFYVNNNKTIFRKKMKQLGLIEQKVNFDWEGTVRML